MRRRSRPPTAPRMMLRRTPTKKQQENEYAHTEVEYLIIRMFSFSICFYPTLLTRGI